jgi:hypothetical protein
MPSSSDLDASDPDDNGEHDGVTFVRRTLTRPSFWPTGDSGEDPLPNFHGFQVVPLDYLDAFIPANFPSTAYTSLQGYLTGYGFATRSTTRALNFKELRACVSLLTQIRMGAYELSDLDLELQETLLRFCRKTYSEDDR